MAKARKSPLWFAVPLLLSWVPAGHAASDQVDNIREPFVRLHRCWEPPPASKAHPDIEITAIVTFRRDGTILGHPRITYESENATDNDRLQHGVAVMHAFHRCTPMLFAERIEAAVSA